MGWWSVFGDGCGDACSCRAVDIDSLSVCDGSGRESLDAAWRVRTSRVDKAKNEIVSAEPMRFCMTEDDEGLMGGFVRHED